MSTLLPLLVVALMASACLGDDAATLATADPTPPSSTVDPDPVPVPPAGTDPAAPQPSTGPATPQGGAEDPQVDLPPIVIDQAVGVAGSGFGGGSIEVSGTANTFEAQVQLELLDQQGNVIEAPFTTATCGSGCRGDWSHVFGDLEPGIYTVAAFESDPSDGEGRPPFRVEVPVEVPAA